MENIPQTMKAMVLHGHGGLEMLRWHEDWPCPVPAAGEVLIRVGACGLNNTDINTRTAWYSKSVREGISVAGGTGGFDEFRAEEASWSSRAITFPRIQGADTAGSIVAVGDGVDATRIGERVIVDGWLLPHGTWFDAARVDYYGSECDGGLCLHHHQGGQCHYHRQHADRCRTGHLPLCSDDGGKPCRSHRVAAWRNSRYRWCFRRCWRLCDPAGAAARRAGDRHCRQSQTRSSCRPWCRYM